MNTRTDITLVSYLVRRDDPLDAYVKVKNGDDFWLYYAVMIDPGRYPDEPHVVTFNGVSFSIGSCDMGGQGELSTDYREVPFEELGPGLMLALGFAMGM